MQLKVVEEKIQAEERKAKQDGNGSKARRMGRICKQYQVITAFFITLTGVASLAGLSWLMIINYRTR